MEAWVSVPIESRQIHRLVEQLGRRGGAADLQHALADAIELWLAEQSRLQMGGNPYPVHGYQWKTVFLPDGTLLRTVSYHDEQCARVQGNQIIFNGRVVTPNQLAHWAGRGTRNAWNDIYVRRPQDKYYIHASRLRLLVRQEQEQEQEQARATARATAQATAQATAYSGSDALASATSAGTSDIAASADAAGSAVAIPANHLLADLVSACAAVQKTLQTHSLLAPAAEPAPRDCSKGEGWVLPERRKFRFRLEDVAFS